MMITEIFNYEFDDFLEKYVNINLINFFCVIIFLLYSEELNKKYIQLFKQNSQLKRDIHKINEEINKRISINVYNENEDMMKLFNNYELVHQDLVNLNTHQTNTQDYVSINIAKLITEIDELDVEFKETKDDINRQLEELIEKQDYNVSMIQSDMMNLFNRFNELEMIVRTELNKDVIREDIMREDIMREDIMREDITNENITNENITNEDMTQDNTTREEINIVENTREEMLDIITRNNIYEEESPRSDEDDINNVSPKSKRPNMKEELNDNMLIRHKIGENDIWYGMYHLEINKIVRGNDKYKSPSSFASKHYRLSRPDRTDRANGWDECECLIDEVNDIWIKLKELRKK